MVEEIGREGRDGDPQSIILLWRELFHFPPHNHRHRPLLCLHLLEVDTNRHMHNKNATQIHKMREMDGHRDEGWGV